MGKCRAGRFVATELAVRHGTRIVHNNLSLRVQYYFEPTFCLQRATTFLSFCKILFRVRNLIVGIPVLSGRPRFIRCRGNNVHGVRLKN